MVGIDKLKELHIPVDSFILAVRMMAEKQYSKNEYENLTNQILGDEIDTSSPDRKTARYRLLYVIQELVQQHQHSNKCITAKGVWLKAKQRTEKILKDYPWLISNYDISSPSTANHGEGLRERARSVYHELCNTHTRKEIIAEMMERLDMKSTTASTYYSFFKKGK